MLLNKRWIWLDELTCSDELDFAIFRLYPGSWMLAYAQESLGPFDTRQILRAARMACTPCIDGCELGPSQLGARALSCARRPLQRKPSWQKVTIRELPVSVTIYERSALDPLRGCCTTFASMPNVAWTNEGPWKVHAELPTARGGNLLAPWNAHPAGSVVVADADLVAGFTVVDLP